MSVALEFQDTIANIILSGNVDYSMQEDLRQVTKDALTGEGVNEIHVNCAELKFLDSSVIRALLTLQTEAHAARKLLVLMNCSETTREVFEIGGFDRMFTFR